MTALTVKQLSPSKLKAYKGNPRVNEDAIDRVADSITQFGFRQPIVVDRSMVIIVGHTRWLAAKRLELEKVPVHIADLTEAQARAYRLADNKTAEYSDWDFDKLAAELTKVQASDIPLSSTGFMDSEVAKILAGVSEDLKNAAEGKTPSGDSRLVLSMTADDREEVYKAIKHAQETTVVKTAGEALAFVARCYLGGLKK